MSGKSDISFQKEISDYKIIKKEGWTFLIFFDRIKGDW